jgi:hypothetical protein
VGRFGADAHNKLQGYQMRKYPTGYVLFVSYHSWKPRHVGVATGHGNIIDIFTNVIQAFKKISACIHKQTNKLLAWGALKTCGEPFLLNEP